MTQMIDLIDMNIEVLYSLCSKVIKAWKILKKTKLELLNEK